MKIEALFILYNCRIKMNKYILLIVIVLATFSTGLAQKLNNEVALVVAPLKFSQQSSYQLLYRKSLKEDLKLRAGLRAFAQIDKETRTDTVITNRGTVQYDISIGIQKDLSIKDVEFVNLYMASDLYFNSAFNRGQEQDYYGYYWSTGIKPLVGVSYKPFDNIRLSFESRANLNVNMQQYDGTGSNNDQRVSFRPLDQLAIGLGYLF
jgi:hypothetical protein